MLFIKKTCSLLTSQRAGRISLMTGVYLLHGSLSFKRLQHFPFAGQEIFRQVEFLTVISRTVYDDLIFDLPRGPGHDIDPVRQQDRFIDIMCDEDGRQVDLLHNIQIRPFVMVSSALNGSSRSATPPWDPR